MAPELPPTHQAIAFQGLRKPPIAVDAPTFPPQEGEVAVQVHWSSASPLLLHQSDGGLLVEKYPAIIGETFAGKVLQLGPGPHTASGLAVGDDVMGYSFRKHEDGKEAGAQEIVTVPSFLVGRMPPNLTMPQAVTVTDNLVTVFQAAAVDLGLPLPWPVPQNWAPADPDAPFLLWGGAGSVGMYALQVLRHWGYGNLIAVASGKHHDYLRSLGAKACFDYRDPDVVEQIRAHAGPKGVPYVIDCIGHLSGTVQKIAQVADRGTKVAVMLPVIVKDASETEAPEYQMGAPGEGLWKDGVTVRGVRTHFYLENEFFKAKMQSEIVPTLLEQGIVKPNPHEVVEGRTHVERVEKVLGKLRKKEVSGARLVWRVTD